MFYKLGSLFGGSSSASKHHPANPVNGAPTVIPSHMSSRRASQDTQPFKLLSGRPSQRRAHSHSSSLGSSNYPYAEPRERPVFTRSRAPSLSSELGHRLAHGHAASVSSEHGHGGPRMYAHSRTDSFSGSDYSSLGRRSRTNSSAAYLTPNTSSSSLYTLPSASRGVYTAEPRPILKHNSTWPPAAYPGTTGPKVKLHQILTYNRRKPPIVYNILYAPNHISVLDPATHKPLSSHSLNLPATSPAVTQLTLSSPLLPWSIVVTSQTSARHAITNLDVLQAIHAALRVPATKEEWKSLGEKSEGQRKIAEAYEKRCTLFGKGWESGVRRSDWLCGKTILVGIERKDDDSYKLVLGR